ncbi:MAG: aspartate/glutamate racemase family protein [Salinirussus sp.]
MYGWRARLGLIVPSLNTTAEPEFAAPLPDGVSVHTARLKLDAGTTDELRDMTAELDPCLDRLGTANPDAVALGCTTSSILNGPEDLEARMTDRLGVPSVTTAASLGRALDALGAARIAVVTPYVDELNAIEREYLEECGFEVVAFDGLGIEAGQTIGERFPEQAYRQARAVDTNDAEALVISCANYRTREIVPQLEADIGLPVVTSNSATLWDVIRHVDIDQSRINGGMLFEKAEA